MTRGRKPQPLEQKKLHGNPGKRALNKNAPKMAEGYPSPPDGMDDLARSVWFSLGGIIDKAIIKLTDQWTLEVFCSAIAQYRRATAAIAEKGDVIQVGAMLQKNPWHTVLRDAIAVIDKFGAKLGLSPAERSKIVAPGGEENDPLTELMNRGGRGNTG